VQNTYLVLILCLQQSLIYDLDFDYRLLVLYSEKDIVFPGNEYLRELIHSNECCLNVYSVHGTNR